MQEGVVNVPQSGPRLLVLTDVGEDAAEGRAWQDTTGDGICHWGVVYSQSFLPWHLHIFLFLFCNLDIIFGKDHRLC